MRVVTHVYSKDGRLLYAVTYPEGDKLEAPEYNVEAMAAAELDECLNSTVSHERLPDTLRYSYNKKGLLMHTNQEFRAKDISEVDRLFRNEGRMKYDFYQCYEGEEEMESFMRQKLGFTPSLILVEIYRYGVFSFWLNPEDQKYYRGKTLVLEK